MNLSNRDMAFLIWLAVLAAFVVARRDTRASLVEILRAFRGKIAVLLAAYATYVTTVVLIAGQLGFWNIGILKDTLAWFIVPGLVLLFGFSKAYQGRRYYGRTLLRIVGLTAIVEFYVNLGAFPLWAELILLPTLVVLAATSAVAGLKPETQIAKRFADRLAAGLGVLLLVGTGAYVVGNWDGLDQGELALSFVTPIWLTAAALPFIFAFSLIANYEDNFVRIGFFAKDDPTAMRRAKLALVASFHIRNRDLHQFAGVAPQEVAASRSWGEARRVIAFHRAAAKLEEAKKELAAKRLARYAGVAGTDWEGRPLDEREFDETRQALDLLATFHQAHFKNGRYRVDLMTTVGGMLSKTFAETEIVMVVKKNGHAWYGWRRTVAGWVLGIGATAPPPDRWVYEKEDPPGGFPKKNEGWRHGDFKDRSETND
jgi:hypothetical protein